MNTNLRKLLIRVSKLSAYAMVFCFSLTVGICDTGAQQKLLEEISIDLDYQGTSLIELIEKIEKSSDFLFVYSQKELRNKTVEVASRNWNMNDLLHEMSNQAKLSIRRVNETISVTSVNRSPQVVDLIVSQTQITGKITDENAEGLPGASVVVTGTTNGTITDADGMYTLNIPAGAVTLDISFVGMKTQTITINGRSVIDVSLSSEAGQLEEVVVIGYGERQKKDLTSSISTVGSKEIEESAFLSPAMAMQGKMAGVRVVTGNGNANSQPQIYVRGIGTFAGASQPLYVVDGQIITEVHADNRDLTDTNTNLWNMIDPNDIESISVLKDASAAAIYGSRGANGVILITTKRGKIGTPKVEFSSRTGFSNIPKYDMLNTKQLRDLTIEAWSSNSDPSITLNEDLFGVGVATRARLNGYAPGLQQGSPFYYGDDTYDWQEAGLRKGAKIEDYDVKISGATEAFDYYFSVGYANQENTLVGGGVKRYNLTTNINSHLGDYITAGATVRIGYNEVDQRGPGNLNDLANISPWQPIYAGDSPYANPFEVSTLGWAVPAVPRIDSLESATTWNMARLYGEQTKSHPFTGMGLGRSWNPEIRNMGQGYIKIEPIKGLSIRGGLSLDHVFSARRNVSDIRGSYYSISSSNPANQGAGDGTTFGSAGVRQSRRFNYQADLMINYNKTFGKHSIDLSFIAQDTYYKDVIEDFSNTQTTSANWETVTWNNDASSISFLARREAYWYGYAARGSYSYGSKYYLDVAVRRDASSGFPDDKDLRWGVFPSLSGAWRISDESFFNASFINNLKVRGGWGQAGNDESAVAKFAYLSQAITMSSYAFGQGLGNSQGSYNQAYLLTGFPNSQLSWETATTTYIGFDALLLNNKLTVTMEFYNRLTEGILQSVVLPYTVGTLNPLQNIGDVVNQGLDIELGYNGSVSDFQYNVGGNIAFVKNEVKKLYNGAPITTSLGRVEVGRPIGVIWGYQVGGIFQSDAEVAEHFADVTDVSLNNNSSGVPNYVQAGDMWFKDIGRAPTAAETANQIYYSTVPDSVINTYDQTQIGKIIPTFTYGINLGGGWKGLDISLNWYGEVGADKYNTVRAAQESMQSRGVGQSITTLDRWTPENHSTTMPRAVAGDPAQNLRYSDRFVESANFFRLQNWTLGYTLPKSIVDNLDFISRFRVYIGGQNNIYMFKWTGIDPASPNIPLSRSVWVGLNVSF